MTLYNFIKEFNIPDTFNINIEGIDYYSENQHSYSNVKDLNKLPLFFSNDTTLVKGIKVNNNELTLILNVDSKDLTKFKEEVYSGVSTWEINCDGWYPYCCKCNYEPDRADVINHKGSLPRHCPRCNSYMKNYLEFEERK